MSNPTGGFGLRPVRRRDGAAWTGALSAVQLAYNNAHAIAKGDPVVSLGTGFIDLWASGVIRGVFWGCEYLDPVNNYVPLWPLPILAHHAKEQWPLNTRVIGIQPGIGRRRSATRRKLRRADS